MCSGSNLILFSWNTHFVPNILVFDTVSTLCPSSPYAIILSKSGKNAVAGRWFCCMLLWMHWPFCCIICLPVFGHWAISEKCFNCFHKWQWHVVTASKLLIWIALNAAHLKTCVNLSICFFSIFLFSVFHCEMMCSHHTPL